MLRGQEAGRQHPQPRHRRARPPRAVRQGGRLPRPGRLDREEAAEGGRRLPEAAGRGLRARRGRGRRRGRRPRVWGPRLPRADGALLRRRQRRGVRRHRVRRAAHAQGRAGRRRLPERRGVRGRRAGPRGPGGPRRRGGPRLPHAGAAGLRQREAELGHVGRGEVRLRGGAEGGGREALQGAALRPRAPAVQARDGVPPLLLPHPGERGRAGHGVRAQQGGLHAEAGRPLRGEVRLHGRAPGRPQEREGPLPARLRVLCPARVLRGRRGPEVPG
mmetsp:Transcript_26680/g.75375  ORF Transcript_26680/g.75375 Transcript_26680/m.75375 type:complete len:274 (+) Transcript_26680:697-1518(+)